MSQSLYIHLLQQRPDIQIDVLAPPWSEPILARMPQVNRTIVAPLAHRQLGLAKRRRLGKELREQHYEQAIILPNSLKSALIPFFANIPQRTGWRGEMRYGLLNDLRRLNETALPLMVEQFVALGQPANTPLPETIPTPFLTVDPAKVEACRLKFGLDRDKSILALCPGAEFGTAKCWPVEYYGQMARQYLDKGWQIVLYGSANDAPVTEKIRMACSKSPQCFDLAGKTQLAEAVDLLSLSAAVLSNDSGLMHIASALGRPLLVIYGPTSTHFTPPLSECADSILPTQDCAPCFQRECPLGHHRCMRDTTPEKASGRLESLLASTASRP